MDFRVGKHTAVHQSAEKGHRIQEWDCLHLIKSYPFGSPAVTWVADTCTSQQQLITAPLSSSSHHLLPLKTILFVPNTEDFPSNSTRWMKDMQSNKKLLQTQGQFCSCLPFCSCWGAAVCAGHYPRWAKIVLVTGQQRGFGTGIHLHLPHSKIAAVPVWDSRLICIAASTP